jgi:hypothetical protein
MALHSLHWDQRFRLRRCHDNPIGWPLYDATHRRVGRVVDLLADDRSHQVVYAIAEVEGTPPVLIDLSRLDLDGHRRRVDVALSLSALQMLSPATWWRRPPALQREARTPAVTGQEERIVVPVYGEQLVTEKRPVIIEEIVITKRQGVRRELVRETLRRESAEVAEILSAPPRPETEARRAA